MNVHVAQWEALRYQLEPQRAGEARALSSVTRLGYHFVHDSTYFSQDNHLGF